MIIFGGAKRRIAELEGKLDAMRQHNHILTCANESAAYRIESLETRKLADQRNINFLRKTCDELRDTLAANGTTPAEREFLLKSAKIFADGNSINRGLFTKLMQSVARQRLNNAKTGW